MHEKKQHITDIISFVKNEQRHRDQGRITLVHASNVAYVHIILYKQHEYR